MLKDIEQPKPEQTAQGFKVWNPAIYKQDKANLMPIITPAFPSMCSTFNITESTKKVIIHEIKRASKITHNIFAGKAQWSDLFKQHTFFTSDHKYYLTVIASAFNADAAKKWSGLVESKVRHLVMRLEDMKESIVLARPFTKGFKRLHKCKNEEQIREVQKGSLKYKTDETKAVETTDPELVTTNGNATPVPLSNGENGELGADAHTVYTYTYYIGIDTQAKGSLNLVPAFQAFKSICSGWNNYNPEVHFLNLAVSKRYVMDHQFNTPDY
jgi:poly(A) polymerase